MAALVDQGGHRNEVIFGNFFVPLIVYTVGDEPMNNDAAALEILKASLGPDEIEELLAATQKLPGDWSRHSVQRNFQFLRCRLHFTQAELAEKAGLAQSQVSRVESGADVRLSTLRRAYAAMGLHLVLIPVTAMTVPELEKAATIGRPEGHWRRQRTRPRRPWRWLESPFNPESAFHHRSDAMATSPGEGGHRK